VHGPRIMLDGRLITAAIAVCGIFFQVCLMSFLAGGWKNGTLGGAILVFAFCTWFNSYFPGLYPISIRPDIAGVAASTLALYFFMRYASGGGLKWLCAASAAWAVTWCFKQADIACIFGAGVYLVASRKWLAAVVLSIVFAIPVGLVLMMGSPEYRWNILVAPTANGLNLLTGSKALLMGAPAVLFTAMLVLTLPWYLRRELRNDSRPAWQALLESMRPGTSLAPVLALAVIVICGFVPSFAALCKTGSSLNQVFEITVAASVLSFALVLRLAASMPATALRRFYAVVCVVLLSSGVLPALQLALNRIGPITRATDADIARKEAFSKFLTTLKKPLFIDDEIYSLPWHESDNQYPAIKLDPVFYYPAQQRGMISGGVEGLVKKHWFATLYVSTNSPLYGSAIAADYHLSPIAPEQTRYLDSLNRESEPSVLLVAP
jgi:hypothetical protein